MFDELLKEIRACKVCEPFLALGANPVVQAAPNSKIVIIGQASAVPFTFKGIS